MLKVGCEHYNKGKCSSVDAPNPGRSWCILKTASDAKKGRCGVFDETMKNAGYALAKRVER